MMISILLPSRPLVSLNEFFLFQVQVWIPFLLSIFILPSLSLNATFTFFSSFRFLFFLLLQFLPHIFLRYSRSIFVFLAVSIMLCNLWNSDRYLSSSSELLTVVVSTCSHFFWNVLILICNSFCNSVVFRNWYWSHSFSPFTQPFISSIFSMNLSFEVDHFRWACLLISFPFYLFVYCFFTFLFIVALSSTIVAFKRLITSLIRFNLFTGVLYNSCDDLFFNEHRQTLPCSLYIFLDVSLPISCKKILFCSGHTRY